MNTKTTPSTYHVGLGGVIASEWTKFRSVRSTQWALLCAATLYLLATIGLVGLTVSTWADLDESTRALVAFDPAATILGSGFLVAQVAIMVLGVLVSSSEYTSGAIKSTMLAVPGRTAIVVAKTIVLGAVVFAVMYLCALMAFLAGAAILADKVPVALDDPGVFRAVTGTALYLTLLAVFSVAVGFLVRSTAAGITFMLAMVLVVAPMVQLIPGRAGEVVHSYLPTEAGMLIGQAKQAPADLLTPWQGFGVFSVWTALVLVLAAVLLKRRDA